MTPPADVPIDPLAITVFDVLNEIEVPAKRAKSPRWPRDSFGDALDGAGDAIDVSIKVGLEVGTLEGVTALEGTGDTSEPPTNVIDPNARARPSIVAPLPTVIDD